jgi:cyclase
MQRERITEDIFVFTSDLYVQVTAGVILTTEGAVLLDTLPYPEETKAIKQFVEERLGRQITYVINTHFHADHTTGTCFFPGARVVAHEKCRELLDARGRESIALTRSTSNEMHDLTLVLPNQVFDSRLTLYLGNKTLKLWSTPGHSPDSIVCLVEEDQVLFGADTMMPVPYFVDGSYDDFLISLRALQGISVESIVQGHGEIVLRGEVEEKIQSDIEYLELLSQAVYRALLQPLKQQEQALAEITIESCGKSRILLNGAAQQLHWQNVSILAEQRRETDEVQY